jgi:hypothetical protein
MFLAMLVVAIAVLLQPTTAPADVLLIEEVRQVDKMELPRNGMNKSSVRSDYGEPKQTHAAVGDPPISRWDYDGWSVYFEYDLVLYSVLHKGQALDRNPS